MQRVESILQQMDFERRYYSDKSGGSTPTYTYEDSVISMFARANAQGASVAWRKTDGRLQVEFAERGTSFSPQGRETLAKLLENLRTVFGRTVAIAE